MVKQKVITIYEHIDGSFPIPTGWKVVQLIDKGVSATLMPWMQFLIETIEE